MTIPRPRAIKPEFCLSERIAELSIPARLLFVLSWMFCDDHGIHPASCKQLRMECNPGDDYTAGDIRNMVDEWLAQQLIVEYEVGGRRYWQVTDWQQPIDKSRARYLYPLPAGAAQTAPALGFVNRDPKTAVA